MKANELMIGDLIRIPHIKKNGKVYRIDQANGDGNGFAAVINGDFHESLLEPIPLTSEILEANGWEKVPQTGCANPYHWQMEKYEDDRRDEVYLLYRIMAHETFFRGMLVTINYPSACETISFRKQIEFIHELQHALRMCGIDKEIIVKEATQ